MRGKWGENLAKYLAGVKGIAWRLWDGTRKTALIWRTKLRIVWLIIRCPKVPALNQSKNGFTIFVQKGNGEGLPGEQQEAVRDSTSSFVEVGTLRIVEYVPLNAVEKEEDSGPGRDNPDKQEDKPDAENQLSGGPESDARISRFT